MYALGVPTTRALAAIATGKEVYRENILPGAILTRVAASHIRVGTFQYGAARGDENKSVNLPITQLPDTIPKRPRRKIRIWLSSLLSPTPRPPW